MTTRPGAVPIGLQIRQVLGMFGDPPPTCGRRWQVLDTGPEQLRGQTFSANQVIVDTWLDVVHVGEFVVSRKDVKAIVGHDFPDYGMRRSWCRHCGEVGHFHFESGTYRSE